MYNRQKVISDGSHDFDNPKACGDTSIFDGLVQINAAHVTDACLVLDAIDHMELSDWQKGKSVQITKPILRVEVDKQRKLNPVTLKLRNKV